VTTMTTLPIDVVLGVPEPTRARWQPLRAGILNLFLYDEQVFAFHNGRLLLRGNNGTGKSMALEVLLPYLLDAELTPSRLSTFGGRDRSMHLWLIGFDKTGVRTSERGYTWVEFGRRLPDGRCEYLTAGAMLEGTRDSPVKAHYFTTAARIGVHLSVGRPGTEPLNAKQLGAALAEQAALGRPGMLHADPAEHRSAVNETLYGLSEPRYAALRRTLLQLRRPKLSDKLDEKGLSDILRESLPPVSDAIVDDLAEGFERLDRHGAAVAELEETIRHLRRIRDAYRGYARIASAARADAVAAAESAITAVGEKSTTAVSALETAKSALAAIRTRHGQVDGELARIRGQANTLRRLEAYQKGQDVEPLRVLVTSLRTSATHAAQAADRAERASTSDAASAERAVEVAIAARDHTRSERDTASASAGQARTQALDAQLAATLDALTGTDAPDEDATEQLIAAARELLSRLDDEAGAWGAEVQSLTRLSGDARKDAAALATARAEVRRAQSDVEHAEEALNARLEEDSDVTLTWICELDRWAEDSPQLRAGQASPLPWDPETVLERAPRWAAESAAARTTALLGEQERHLLAAGERDTAAASAADTAQKAEDIVGLLTATGRAAEAHVKGRAVYRDAVAAWAVTARELNAGEPSPHDHAAWPLDGAREAASAWATRAGAIRARALLAEQSAADAETAGISGIIAQLQATELHLAEGGLPEPAASATRQASRDGRAGAPLYMLVDFTPSVSEADQLGIEAAAIGSGIADAWLSPDGRLLSSSDGGLLLDTQLDASAPTQAGVTLADVLMADDGCQAAGVPAAVVTAVLTRVGCARSAQAAGNEAHLVLGKDGSWRAGSLTGAYRAGAVTLIGARNREAARLSALAGIRRQLEEQHQELRRSESRSAQIAASLGRLEAERSGLPTDDEVNRLREAAHEAAAEASRAAADLQARTARSALSPPPGTEADESPLDARTSDLTRTLGLLAADVRAAPSAASAPSMGRLAVRAQELTAAWMAAAAARRAQAEECRELRGAVERERAAIPDAVPVRQARTNITAAMAEQAGAHRRLATREEEEEPARHQSSRSNAALRTALLANSLPEDCDIAALASAVAQYRPSAAEWLRTGIDELRALGTAQLAHTRSIDSADTASRQRTEANRQAQQLQEKEAELSELTSKYGSSYQQIVADLARLTDRQQQFEQEKAELSGEETTQIQAQATAEAILSTLDQQRAEADRARSEATAAFLAAHQRGMLAMAGLPDTPPGRDITGPEDAPAAAVAAVGPRAARDWARAVREAVGDPVARDAPAVEAAANRVNEIRYNLEPALAGKVSIRDERRDGLLILQATRGTHALPIVDMIAALAEEHVRDQQLLAQHETELFRMFLADTTRREVTTKVRDARTAIKAMSALISGHPTGSGIQVRLNWVPDEKNAPGMQDIVGLMAKDAPLESERARLQDFFRSHLATVRATSDADYRAQMERLLDYRQWWRFTISFRHSQDQPYEPLTSKAHGSLSGGEKAVCLHLPLFAAAASYCDSAGVRATGGQGPGSPRLILLDEVFAGVDEDNRGDLFELVRTLDLDMVATSESEQGFYRQLDGLAVYHLVSTSDAVAGTRTLWDGTAAHRMLDLDLDLDLGPVISNRRRASQR
jgi:Putative exonuclease SbcCD, C subunit